MTTGMGWQDDDHHQVADNKRIMDLDGRHYLVAGAPTAGRKGRLEGEVVSMTRTRNALDLRGDLKRTDEAFEASIEHLAQVMREDLGQVRLSLKATMDSLLEEARAEGYHQALIDCNAALLQGLPALNLLLTIKMPPRPVGQEIDR